MKLKCPKSKDMTNYSIQPFFLKISDIEKRTLDHAKVLKKFLKYKFYKEFFFLPGYQKLKYVIFRQFQKLLIDCHGGSPGTGYAPIDLEQN